MAADVHDTYGGRSLPDANAAAKAKMEKAATDLDFIAAAKYRNEMYALQERQRIEEEGDAPGGERTPRHRANAKR